MKTIHHFLFAIIVCLSCLHVHAENVSTFSLPTPAHVQIDNFDSREDSIVVAFHDKYDSSDIFNVKGYLSPHVRNVDINNRDIPELEYSCSPLVLDVLDFAFDWNIFRPSIRQSMYSVGNDSTVYYYHGDVPGGVRTALKTYRAADKVRDISKLEKTIDKIGKHSKHI